MISVDIHDIYNGFMSQSIVIGHANQSFRYTFLRMQCESKWLSFPPDVFSPFVADPSGATAGQGTKIT